MLKTYHYILENLQDHYPKSEIKNFASIIFEKLLNISLVNIFSDSDKTISENDFLKIVSIVNRLQNNEPIQYIFGETEFFGLSFLVTNDVLIPRPETEELVEWILSNSSPTLPYRILDIGTGSGCIAVSLAKNLPNAIILAIDISNKALSVAEKNAEKNSVVVHFEQVDILKNDFTFPFGKFDIIVSNPPYIMESEKINMKKNVLEYEPEKALFVPDNNPLLFYKRIAEFSKMKLNKNGSVHFEINSAFGKETVNMLKKTGYNEVILKKDISGKDRMVYARL